MNDVPTLENCRLMWDEIDFVPNYKKYPNVAEFIEKLAKVYTNGKVLHHSFRLPNHSVFNWYSSRNKFHEMGFFERFWLKPSIQTLIPQRLAPLNFYSKDVFEWSSPFLLGGSLAWTLSSGGAYERHQKGVNDAKRIGDAASDDLIASDYESPLLFVSHKAWSDFFFDVAWDHCWLLIHPPQNLIHTILATDTD
jgi:hypothetical protein